MNNQGTGSQYQLFLNNLVTNGVGLAYFLGSQKELGLARLRGAPMEGKPDSDLDLGVVLLEHPLDYWEGQRLRQRLLRRARLTRHFWCVRRTLQREISFLSPE